MKQAFRDQRITETRGAMIQTINEILNDYSRQGYKLTLRQLYYQLVARDIVANVPREYAKLSQTCVIGRMNGLIDWSMLEDRVRKPHLEYAVDSVGEAIQDTIRYYKLNRQKGQPTKIEIWTEKDAVSNILKRVSTHSAMYDAYRRITYCDENEKVILYVGDYDPSGLDMLRDIRERLDEFGVRSFAVVPVALTLDQINKYNPPPNPAKITDPRARWYIAEHGNKSWELDALSPEVLEKIVKKAVLAVLDTLQFDIMLGKEEEDKEKLQELIGTLEG